MMKRYISVILLTLACCAALAQGRIVERTYVSTDRSDYLAGEVVRCSVFCFDLSEGRTLSDFSSIAYIGLFSPDGLVQSAKAALDDGRGAAEFELDRSLPTGNYRLIAFTAMNRNEFRYDYDATGKTISIFNPYTSQRVENGVEIVDASEYAAALAQAGTAQDTGLLRLRLTGDARKNSSVGIAIDNLSGSDASFNVSVTCDEGVIPASDYSITSFLGMDTPSPIWQDRVVPEYEGEIIHARVAGVSRRQLLDMNGKFAFISVPGDKSDMYSAPVSWNGEISFFTNNIYGRKDMICEIEGLEEDTPAHLEIISPFVEAKAGPAGKLLLSSSLSEMIRRRSVHNQIERTFRSDTLYEHLPFRDNLLFGQRFFRYHLDDYTRFPLMEEVITEFIPELRARKQDGVRDIRVRMEDSFNSITYSRGTSLMMLDGVPIFDHEKIMNYDPLLVETIDIYPATYYIGTRGYEGIVNFITYKHNIQGMQFDQNVRIVSFEGASYPTAFTCANVISDSSYPDYRETLYWHPIMSVGGSGSEEIECKLPAYDGKFRIVVEGVTSDGRPIHETLSFEIR